MGGNVWEWVQDEWHDNYEGAPTDGSGWCAGTCPANASAATYNASTSALRVLRGGAWYDDADCTRAAYRYDFTPADQYYYSGGRLSRSLP